MLNADMELAFDVVDANGADIAGINNCGGRNSQCTENRAVSAHAREFSNDNAAFLTQFSTSYKLMTEVGYANAALKCVFDTSGAPVGGVLVSQCTNTSGSPTGSTTSSVPLVTSSGGQTTRDRGAHTHTHGGKTMRNGDSLDGGSRGGSGASDENTATSEEVSSTAASSVTIVAAALVAAAVGIVMLAVMARRRRHSSTAPDEIIECGGTPAVPELQCALPKYEDVGGQSPDGDLPKYCKKINPIPDPCHPQRVGQ
jgi:hypothetical protein